ncbi:DUF1835 domain-containing protein [Algoriphagus sediminis]|uniref:DUF1835 domain-containing protein n=1 Tax=Algoriphagus sediminis TaxID=3057113 RepID=A0ABT7Y9P1_9BACT|nr:DUF1835 domain-containing protein [Algoriphagus sediminis]MDN3203233.1 DUF1835 domain-containing protein [Algoriphagus sediminis]
MNSKIHILNGDALGDRFPATIPGDRIILRECLCYGPTDHENEDELFEKRAIFLEKLDPAYDYSSYVRPELNKLTEIPNDSEVYCWFEEDLFCQVNFWFSVHQVSKRTQNISLVLPHSDLIYGFGTLDRDGLEKAFARAQKLSESEIQTLSNLWKAFSRADVSSALSISKTQSEPLPFLLESVLAWKDSLPSSDSQGKPIEAMLEISAEFGTEDFRKIFPVFHKRYPIYGYGDLIAQDIWEKRKK